MNKRYILSLHQFFFTYWEKTPLCLHHSSCFLETRNNEHLNTQGRLHQQPRQDPVKRLRGDIIIKAVMLMATRITAVSYSLVNRCCMSFAKIHGFASHKGSMLSDIWYLRALEGNNYEGLRGKGAENSGDGRVSPTGGPVELLTEYFWRAPDREHLSLWELC